MINVITNLVLVEHIYGGPWEQLELHRVGNFHYELHYFDSKNHLCRKKSMCHLSDHSLTNIFYLLLPKILLLNNGSLIVTFCEIIYKFI